MENLHDIILFRRSHEGRLPNRGSNAPADEQRLGNHRYKLHMRCTKALGDYPSERMLNAEERAHFQKAVAEAIPEIQPEQPPSENHTICGAVQRPVKASKKQTKPNVGAATLEASDGVSPPVAETCSAGVSPPGSISGVPPPSAETRRIWKICTT